MIDDEKLCSLLILKVAFGYLLQHVHLAMKFQLIKYIQKNIVSCLVMEFTVLCLVNLQGQFYFDATVLCFTLLQTTKIVVFLVCTKNTNFIVCFYFCLAGVADMCQMNNANCSHYCEFDYDLLEFMCHCPQGYILGLDQQTCQEPGTCHGTMVPNI